MNRWKILVAVIMVSVVFNVLVYSQTARATDPTSQIGRYTAFSHAGTIWALDTTNGQLWQKQSGGAVAVSVWMKLGGTIDATGFINPYASEVTSTPPWSR